MIKSYIICLLMLLSNVSYSQKKNEPVEIKKIELLSGEFQNSLDKFIDFKTLQDSSFRLGRGFVVINSQHVHATAPPNAVAAFYVNLDYYDLDNTEKDEIYPPYYAISSSGRLIMIYDRSVVKIAKIKYTSESKAVLRELLEPFLPKYKMIPKFNDSTKLAKLRESYRIQLHGGRYFFILNDGSVMTKDENQR